MEFRYLFSLGTSFVILWKLSWCLEIDQIQKMIYD